MEAKMSDSFPAVVARIHERLMLVEELGDKPQEWHMGVKRDARQRVQQLLGILRPEDLILVFSGHGDPSDRAILRKGVAFAKTGTASPSAQAEVYPDLFPDLSQ